MQQQPQEYAFEFTGNGREYFNIWIVNLLLTILTLGVYSAWAKVRRLQYFYRNTRLADASFEYHGTPKAILKGRLIALGVFIVYTVAGKVYPPVGAAIGLLISGAMPLIIVRSLRFKLYNSSYRGLRFAFAGSYKDAYRVFMLLPIFTMLTLFLLAPFTHQRIKQYEHSNSRFGDTGFSFEAPVFSFYSIYLKCIGMLIALCIVVGILFAEKMRFMLIFLPNAFLIIAAYIAVSLPNLQWNSSKLGNHKCYSRLEMGSYLWISVTNLVAIVFTLGLFIPFAKVRMVRYKLENMGIVAQGDLAEFIVGQTQQISAIGEEAAAMFDVDISL